MRTQQDIANWLWWYVGSGTDPSGRQREIMIYALPYDMAKQYLDTTAITPDQWAAKMIDTDDKVKAAMGAYMPFAWKKANDCDPDSMISMGKFRQWLWLLMDDDLVAMIDNIGDNYYPCGKPILAAICAKYGFPNQDDTTHIDDLPPELRFP